MTIDRISIDPEICSGKPCIAGTRIMIRNILSLMAAGYSIEQVIDEYPELVREDVLAALQFASEFVNRAAKSA